MLVNNAGMYVSKRGYSPEGIERQLAANHVGPFLLTNLLRPQLLAAAKDAPAGATRIINVSSEGHRMQPFRFSDYNGEKVVQEELPEEERINPAMKDQLPPFVLEPEEGYIAFVAYGQSKTANVLFSVGLNERFKGTGVVSYALHPGSECFFFFSVPGFGFCLLTRDDSHLHRGAEGHCAPEGQC